MRTPIRTMIWIGRKMLVDAARGFIPRSLRFTKMISAADASSSSAPFGSVFPEPLVHTPTDPAYREILALHRDFAAGSLTLPPVTVRQLEGATIYPVTGLVADSAGRIVIESAKGVPMLRRSYPFSYPRREPEQAADGKFYATIHDERFVKNHYHLLVDVLPRFYLLSQLPVRVRMLLPETMGPKQRWLFELFRPQNVEFQFVTAPRGIRADRVLVVPYLSAAAVGFQRPEVLAYMRARIAERFPPGDAAPAGCYYITRENRDIRRISNDAALIRALEGLGVTVLRPETMPIEQQIRIFQNARLIVGPHGAGLTNILYAERSGVVEIFPNGLKGKKDLPLYFFGLALSLNHRYRAVLHGYGRSVAHFEVDVDRVTQAVASLLNETKTGCPGGPARSEVDQ